MYYFDFNAKAGMYAIFTPEGDFLAYVHTDEEAVALCNHLNRVPD